MVSSVQVERRWLASLLANEKTVALLLRFLKAAGVGREKKYRWRELEWERRRLYLDKLWRVGQSTRSTKESSKQTGIGAPSGSIKYLQRFGPEERNRSSVVHHA